jgi:hypothetical protein
MGGNQSTAIFRISDAGEVDFVDPFRLSLKLSGDVGAFDAF